MIDKLFVEGKEIFLDPKKPAGYTINGIDLSDITVQKSGYSSKLKIPATPQNLQNLGFPEAVDSEGRPCYRLIPCSYEIQGFQIVPFGVLRIEDIKNEIEATVFSGEAELFKAMQTLKLSDINDLPASNHFWTMDEVEDLSGSALGDNAPLYALINYKKNPVPDGKWNYQYLFPSWYVFDLISLILKDQNYFVDIFNLTWLTSFFQGLIVPFTNQEFKNGPVFVSDHSFEGSASGTTAVAVNYENLSGSLETPQLFQKITIDEEATGNPNFSGGDFSEPNTSTLRVFGSFRVSAFSHSLVDNPPADPPIATYSIALVKNFTTVLASIQIGVDNSLPLTTYNIEAEVSLAQADLLTLMFLTDIESLALGDEVTVSATIADGSFYTQSVDAEIVPGGWVEVAEQLPDIKQADLIRTISTLTASYFVTDPISKKWTFKPFREIAQRKGQAVNWDSKLIRKPGQSFWYISKKTKPQGFFQENRAEWIEDKTVTPGLGNGAFSLSNQALDKSGDILKNVFAASDQRLVNGNAGKSKVCAYLDKFDDDDKPQELEPRLLILDPFDSGFNVTLTDADSGGATGPLMTPQVANFSLVGSANGGLAWASDLQNRYWKELLSALEDFVEVEVFLTLSATDIAWIIEQYQKTSAEIIPIHLQGENWVIKQVKQYRANEFTRVILTKI